MREPGRPLIVLGAGTPWDGVPGTDRRMAAELLRHARVLWVDPAFSVVTRPGLRQGTARRFGPSLDEPEPGLIRLRPVAPPLHTRRRMRPTTRALLRAQIDHALRRLSRRPYAVIDSRMGRMLRGWEPGVRRVLYGTDDFVGGAELMGGDVEEVRRDERVSLDEADVVLAVSPTLADRWHGLGARDVRLLPNGVSALPVAERRESPLPRPVAGVVGQLSDRIDIGLLEALADRDVSLLLIGPRDPRWEPGRFERLTARPHVRWTDRQPHEALPGWFAQMDVGLTPYADSAFNRASFPLKTLEYLAAGLPAVSTGLPATRWLGTDLISVADDPEDFVTAVRRVARQSTDPALIAARRAFAATHSWEARGETLAAILGLIPSPTQETPAWQS